MQIQLKQIIVPPGQQVLLKNVSWHEFERILAELGERRAARISYSNGILEIMTPLPEHEDNKVIIGNFVEILLEELEIEFRNLGLANSDILNFLTRIQESYDDKIKYLNY